MRFLQFLRVVHVLINARQPGDCGHVVWFALENGLKALERLAGKFAVLLRGTTGEIPSHDISCGELQFSLGQSGIQLERFLKISSGGFISLFLKGAITQVQVLSSLQGSRSLGLGRESRKENKSPGSR